MTDPDRGEHRSADQPHPSRRTVLRSLGGATAGVGVGLAGAADARELQPVLHGAFPAPVPTLDRDDLTGIFVQVLRQDGEVETDALDACPGLDDSATPVRYDVRLLDRIYQDHWEVEAQLFTAEGTQLVDPGGVLEEGNTDTPQLGPLPIDTGALYVVNRQRSCDGPFVAVELEPIDASTVGTPAAPGAGEPIEVGVQDTDTPTEDTGVGAPGFGVPVTVVAVASALALAVVRRLRDED